MKEPELLITVLSKSLNADLEINLMKLYLVWLSICLNIIWGVRCMVVAHGFWKNFFVCNDKLGHFSPKSSQKANFFSVVLLMVIVVVSNCAYEWLVVERVSLFRQLFDRMYDLEGSQLKNQNYYIQTNEKKKKSNQEKLLCFSGRCGNSDLCSVSSLFYIMSKNVIITFALMTVSFWY